MGGGDKWEFLQPKIIFIVDAAVVIYRRRRDREAIGRCVTHAVSSIIRKSNLATFHSVSPGRREWNTSTDRRLGIIARRVLFDLFECASPAWIVARYQSYLSLNKTHDGLSIVDASRAENNLSYIWLSDLIIHIRVDKYSRQVHKISHIKFLIIPFDELQSKYFWVRV